MLDTRANQLRLFYMVAFCVTVIASCGGTHGRIGRAWIELTRDSVETLLIRDSLLAIQPILDGTPGQPSLYLKMPVSKTSSEFDTILIHVTIDLVERGVAGCYIGLIGYMPKGSSRYCMQDKCSSVQDAAALRLFETVVLEPLRKHIRVGELES